MGKELSTYSFGSGWVEDGFSYDQSTMRSVFGQVLPIARWVTKERLRKTKEIMHQGSESVEGSKNNKEVVQQGVDDIDKQEVVQEGKNKNKQQDHDVKDDGNIKEVVSAPTSSLVESYSREGQDYAYY